MPLNRTSKYQIQKYIDAFTEPHIRQKELDARKGLYIWEKRYNTAMLYRYPKKRVPGNPPGKSPQSTVTPDQSGKHNPYVISARNRALWISVLQTQIN